MSFDRTDPADLAALKSEVETDPEAKGYDPQGGTQELLDLLNGKTETVPKPSVSARQMALPVIGNFDAYKRLTNNEQEWVALIVNGKDDDEFMPVTANWRQSFAGEGGNSIWAAGDRADMEPQYAALFDVPASRAEVLFGFGTEITRDDWIAARDS